MTTTIQTTTTRSAVAAAEPARERSAHIGATDALGRSFGAVLDGALGLDDAFRGVQDAEREVEPETEADPEAESEADSEASETPDSERSSGSDPEGESKGEDDRVSKNEDTRSGEDSSAQEDVSDEPVRDDRASQEKVSDEDASVEPSVEPGVRPVQGERSVSSESDITRELRKAAQVNLDEIAARELQAQAKLDQAAAAEPVRVERHEPARERGVRADDRPKQPTETVPQGAAKGSNANQRAGASLDAPVVKDAPVQPAPALRVEPQVAAAVPVASSPVPSGATNTATARGSASVGVVSVAAAPSGNTSGSGGQQAGMDMGAQQNTPNLDGITRSGDKMETIRRSVLAHVERGIGAIMKTNGGSIKIRLTPDHLGELQIRLEIKDGVVNARITAETQGAQRLLEEGLASLRSALEAKGVKVDQLVVEGPSTEARFGFGDSQSGGGREHEKHGDNGGHRGGGSEHDGGEEDTESTPERGIWTELGLDAIA